MKVKKEKEDIALAIVTSTPVYFEKTFGFLAKPIKTGTRPGVVMIHEYWGLNEYIKTMAEELAEEGYVVLAVDLFGGEVTADHDRAMGLVSAVNEKRARDNLRSAVRYLREHEGVMKVASLGWCFGGHQSLELALSGEKMDATVIYYGNVISDEQTLSKINWPILGIFGEKDEVVPVATVEKFKGVLDRLKIKNEFHIYPGMGHAFANPSNPGHAPAETIDAWNKTLAFLERNLKK